MVFIFMSLITGM